MPFVCEADRCAAGENEIHIDRTFDCNVAILLLKGSMEIIEDGVPYRLAAGDLFFLKGGVHHWGKSLSRGVRFGIMRTFCVPSQGAICKPIGLRRSRIWIGCTCKDWIQVSS